MTISRATTGVATSTARPPFTKRIRVAAALTIVVGCTVFGFAEADRAVATSSSTAQAAPDSVLFYVVQPSVNGEPEFLFAIAQRFLGDGNRFNEIFALNEGRPQPDGSAMTVATSLNPGWILQLPDDAQGDGLQFGPVEGAAPPQEVAAPLPSTTPEAAVPTASPVEQPADAQPPAADSQEPGASSDGVPVGAVVAVVAVVVALAAAGVYFWLRRRKSRASGARPSFVANDGSSAWTIDSALKIVTAACADDHISFPGLYLVTVDATSIHLLLSTPSAQAPAGWAASADGRTWSASLAYLQTQQVPSVSNAQFSGLVTLGTTDTGRLLLDFANARGVVTVEGPSSAVADVVDGWLTQLAGSPWSGTPQIARLSAGTNGEQETVDDFVARVDRSEKGVAVIDGAPMRAQGDAIRALSATDGWIVIVAGPFAGASWKFSARDGLLSSGFLPDIHYTATAGDRSPAAANAN